jgi:hypothetical protein
LKPLSVTLPYAARFTEWGDSEPVRESAFDDSAKAKTVTVTRWGGMAALARFSISLLTDDSVSDQRAADGRGDGRRQKEAKNNKPTSIPSFWSFPGVCGKLTQAGHGLLPARVNFPQSPVNQLAEQRSFIDGTECSGSEVSGGARRESTKLGCDTSHSSKMDVMIYQALND